MKHRLLSAAVGLMLAGLGASDASAQENNVARFERQLQQIQRDTRLRVNPDIPADQRALIDYGGYFSFNFLAIDDTEQHTHILRQYDLVGYARVNFDNAHEFFLRARTSYRDFNDGDSFDGTGDEMIWPTIEQAYYRFDLARYLAGRSGEQTPNNLVGTFGRQFIYWANGLVLGETLDGANVEITLGNLGVNLLGGVTAHDTVDFDSSRPDFDDRTARTFYGGMVSYQLGKHRPYVYFLRQEDENQPQDLVQPGNTTRFGYDSYYVGIGSNGSIGDRLVYGVEAVYEGGRALSNSFDPSDPNLAQVEQTYEDIDAWALDVRLDYLFADARRSRLSFEVILASGDTDRVHTSNTFGGNLTGTDDEAYNAWGLLNTGLAFATNVSNVQIYRVGGSTFPFPTGALRRMQIGADVLFYGKLESDAPIDETTTNDSFLGWEPDVYLNWQITSDVTLALRYGVFFPGDAIVADEHPRNFFFMGLTFAF